MLAWPLTLCTPCEVRLRKTRDLPSSKAPGVRAAQLQSPERSTAAGIAQGAPAPHQRFVKTSVKLQFLQALPHVWNNVTKVLLHMGSRALG